MASEATERFSAWLDMAHQHYEETKQIPIVIGIELYEYFDDTVKILEATEFGEVLIENRWATKKRIDPEELDLRPRIKR